MPIHFYTDPNQVQIEFLGGDMIVGLCGENEGRPEAVGIGEAPRPGVSGELIDEEIETTPSVLLSFRSEASLDTLIRTLEEYREACFGSKD